MKDSSAFGASRSPYEVKAVPFEADILVGLGGVSRNACVALATPDDILGVCEQERVTRVRGAGSNPSGLPDEALDELLGRSRRERRHIARYVASEPVSAQTQETEQLDHHLVHACAAFLPSPFPQATVVVCDNDAPYISVWKGAGDQVKRVEWPWSGPGFAEIYSRCAQTLGFADVGRDQKMEALARLAPNGHDDRITKLFGLESDRLRLAPQWEARIEEWAASGKDAVATAAQTRLGDLLVEFIATVMRGQPKEPLCLAGSLFLNSYFNTRIKQSGAAAEVFVPVNPGNAGLAVGAVLLAGGRKRRPVTPFLGPRYPHEEIKATLDNCKLRYEWAPHGDILAMVVEDLQKGRLVGWFDGAMEWGPRALGARSILANPFSPYVLDHLNRFLKQRAPWRGYALSGTDSAVHAYFDGPGDSQFMECDYMPRDRELFRHVLPKPGAAVRVQTAGAGAPPLFRELLHAFGKATGHPFVVNTSFNGFSEPIVCSPRDAVRVFFGTGIDTLVMDKFIIRKY